MWILVGRFFSIIIRGQPGNYIVLLTTYIQQIFNRVGPLATWCFCTSYAGPQERCPLGRMYDNHSETHITVFPNMGFIGLKRPAIFSHWRPRGQTSWDWIYAEWRVAPGWEQAASAACNCGPCSRIVADSTKGIFLAIPRCSSGLSVGSRLTAISTIFHLTLDSSVHFRSLQVSNGTSSVESLVWTAAQSDNAGKFRTARKMRLTTDVGRKVCNRAEI